MKLQIIHAEPYRSGGHLYRVILHHLDNQGLLVREYEVWTTVKAVQSRSYNFNGLAQRDQLEAFVKWYYKERLRDSTYDPHTETGAFITEHKIEHGLASSFNDQTIKEDPFVQTNISLPISLHEWIKNESERDKISMSDTIRRVLLHQYKERSYICTKCGKKRYGEPMIENKDKDLKHCYDCFLKTFEEAA